MLKKNLWIFIFINVFICILKKLKIILQTSQKNYINKNVI